MAITASFGAASWAYAADTNATITGFSYEGEILSRVACFFSMIAIRLFANSLSLVGFRHVLFSILTPALLTLGWFYSAIFATGREYRYYSAFSYIDDPLIILAEFAIAFALTEFLRQIGKRLGLFSRNRDTSIESPENVG